MINLITSAKRVIDQTYLAETAREQAADCWEKSGTGPPALGMKLNPGLLGHVELRWSGVVPEGFQSALRLDDYNWHHNNFLAYRYGIQLKAPVMCFICQSSRVWRPFHIIRSLIVEKSKESLTLCPAWSRNWTAVVLPRALVSSLVLSLVPLLRGPHACSFLQPKDVIQKCSAIPNFPHA